jgi:type II secretory pathway pseudopilin PulG
MYVEVVKGNGLQSLITEAHSGAEFQATLAAAMERDKAIRVKTQVAALGARRDYIDMVYTSGQEANADNVVADKLLFEMIEFTGVPTNVQYAVFGEDSPFETGQPVVREAELDGIDRQEITIQNNVLGTGTTAVSQEVRGAADSRFQLDADDDTTATKYWIRCKPNEDSVFVLPLGGILGIIVADGFASS